MAGTSDMQAKAEPAAPAKRATATDPVCGMAVDPRVIDLYESGSTIDPDVLTRHRSPARKQRAVEEAVLELLS